MATITATLNRAAKVASRDVWIVQWPAMGNADTGTSVRMGGASDRSVQIEGTFGGATVVIQGSNDGTNWQTLTDPQGNALSKTAAALEQIEELTQYIRASTSGGTGTNLNVTLLLKGMNT